VLGRDEADAQLFAKLGRFLVYKDGGPTLHLTRIEAVQEEAYALLLAERADVRAPRVVAAGTAGPGIALLASRTVVGTPLAELDPADLTDAVLDGLWDQLVRLRRARVTHGLLNGRHVLVTPDGPAVADFGHATGTGRSARATVDVAELLVCTAGLVGPDRAAAAAVRTLGAAAVVEALPMLQPAALSRESRPRKWRTHKDFAHQVDAVRAAAAKAAGTEEPALQQLHRVSGTNLMMAVGTLIAIAALLSQVGSPEELWDTITNASPWWLVVAMVISFATNGATAIALMGTVPIPLPLWRTSELQLSMSFSNLAIPAVGGMAAQIRFLQKQGVDLASAVASGGLLINVGNIVAQVILLGFAVALSPDTFRIESVPTSSIVELVLIVVLVAAVVVGLVLGIPRLRKLVLPPVKSASATMWEALRSPRRVALLLGGNALNALMYAAVMLACVEAFGGSIDYFTLLALNIFISTIASLVPIPGGNTAVSTVGMSGAMTAFGVSTEVAVAAVLANQLVANYLPAVPGWFATNDLLHRDYL
jgi:undecaprenyl-diphosphatase